jgi:hypothetical protein
MYYMSQNYVALYYLFNVLDDLSAAVFLQITREVISHSLIFFSQLMILLIALSLGHYVLPLPMLILTAVSLVLHHRLVTTLDFVSNDALSLLNLLLNNLPILLMKSCHQIPRNYPQLWKRVPPSLLLQTLPSIIVYL